MTTLTQRFFIMEKLKGQDLPLLKLKEVKKPNAELLKIKEKSKTMQKKYLTLNFFLNNLTTILQNISKYWMFGNDCMKKNILKFLFSDGLILNASKRKYLTSNVNILFDISRTISRKWKVLKNKDSSDFTELSCQVSPKIQISNKLIEDLNKIYELEPYILIGSSFSAMCFSMLHI